MKDQEVYDQSTIIICADHGYYWHGVVSNPLLMVKKAGASGDMAESEAPVCHLDIHATVMDDLGLNQDHKYGKSVFEIAPGEARGRKFYQYNLSREKPVAGKYRLFEYLVSDDSNVLSGFSLTGNEYTVDGKIIPHKDHCTYCQEWDADGGNMNGPNTIHFLD